MTNFLKWQFLFSNVSFFSKVKKFSFTTRQQKLSWRFICRCQKHKKIAVATVGHICYREKKRWNNHNSSVTAARENQVTKMLHSLASYMGDEQCANLLNMNIQMQTRKERRNAFDYPLQPSTLWIRLKDCHICAWKNITCNWHWRVSTKRKSVKHDVKYSNANT